MKTDIVIKPKSSHYQSSKICKKPQKVDYANLTCAPQVTNILAPQPRPAESPTSILRKNKGDGFNAQILIKKLKTDLEKDVKPAKQQPGLNQDVRYDLYANLLNS